MKLGMRTIKTGIAVFLCVIVFEIFNMGSAMYACLAAIISMQNTVISSFKAGKNRMIGTTIGAFVGFICASIMPESAILSGIGIMSVIHISNILKSKESLSIAGVVFCAIMLKLEGQSVIVYSFSRIIDTFIGIAIAILVNYFVAPPKYFEKIDEKYKEIVNDIFLLFKDEVSKNKPIDLSKINKDISNFEKLVDTYIEEFRVRKDEEVEIEKIRKVLNECKKIYFNLEIIASLDDQGFLNKENCNNLNKLYNFRFEYLDYDEGDLDIVYNYHIKNIINSIHTLNKTIGICTII
ncbi:aromatic acid exporter family protein [Alkalithermobacter paradoxus]|uniref:Fusaric acid resistance protein family protein n=1 Tax=Alkalithermobacter paradoxus TaxID=29349 RepID=A0A1V4I8V8_9FIRM|nr:fusaric acid resistance protein family protein [[Clostridium] thermoalcaliphilum]